MNDESGQIGPITEPDELEPAPPRRPDEGDTALEDPLGHWQTIVDSDDEP